MKSPLFNKLRNRSADWQVGVVVIFLVALARLLGVFEAVEWSIFDGFLRLRPKEPTDPQVVLVGIDADDLQTIGAYPVPDRDISQLIEQVYRYDPAVVGLSIFRDIPVGEGHADLTRLLQQHPDLVALEKLIPPAISAPSGLGDRQIGFDDYYTDSDGLVRRTFLGLSLTGSGTDFRFSFPLRLAEHYLEERHGLALNNGVRDPVRMRFGEVEIPYINPSATRGYSDEDLSGLQTFLNYRSSDQPFATFSFTDVMSGDLPPEVFENKVVIIGIADPGGARLINTAAVESAFISTGLGSRVSPIFGLEYQAHAASQIIQAVETGRPFITTWSSGWDYLWLAAWGSVGIVLGYLTRSSLKNFAGVIGAMVVLVAIGYSSLAYFGWWLPIAPPLTVLMINGASYATLYRRERVFRERVNERQKTIEQTFNLIHNGPLQTLAGILRTLKETDVSQDVLTRKLEDLNQEIRSVGEYLHNEYLTDEESFYLGTGTRLDLKYPIHELFYEVYDQTLERDFTGFQTLKVRVRDFEPLEPPLLSFDKKRELCRFLEEALCNVGKHAIHATRLTVIGAWRDNWYSLSVTDNGMGSQVPHRNGEGTQRCLILARKLKGKFIREPAAQRGIKCELTWPATGV